MLDARAGSEGPLSAPVGDQSQMDCLRAIMQGSLGGLGGQLNRSANPLSLAAPPNPPAHTTPDQPAQSLRHILPLSSSLADAPGPASPPVPMVTESQSGAGVEPSADPSADSPADPPAVSAADPPGGPLGDPPGGPPADPPAVLAPQEAMHDSIAAAGDSAQGSALAVESILAALQSPRRSPKGAGFVPPVALTPLPKSPQSPAKAAIQEPAAAGNSKTPLGGNAHKAGRVGWPFGKGGRSRQSPAAATAAAAIAGASAAAAAIDAPGGRCLESGPGARLPIAAPPEACLSPAETPPSPPTLPFSPSGLAEEPRASPSPVAPSLLALSAVAPSLVTLSSAGPPSGGPSPAAPPPVAPAPAAPLPVAAAAVATAAPPEPERSPTIRGVLGGFLPKWVRLAAAPKPPPALPSAPPAKAPLVPGSSPPGVPAARSPGNPPLETPPLNTPTLEAPPREDPPPPTRSLAEAAPVAALGLAAARPGAGSVTLTPFAGTAAEIGVAVGGSSGASGGVGAEPEPRPRSNPGPEPLEGALEGDEGKDSHADGEASGAGAAATRVLGGELVPGGGVDSEAGRGEQLGGLRRHVGGLAAQLEVVAGSLERLRTGQSAQGEPSQEAELLQSMQVG